MSKLGLSNISGHRDHIPTLERTRSAKNMAYIFAATFINVFLEIQTLKLEIPCLIYEHQTDAIIDHKLLVIQNGFL